MFARFWHNQPQSTNSSPQIFPTTYQFSRQYFYLQEAWATHNHPQVFWYHVTSPCPHHSSDELPATSQYPPTAYIVSWHWNQATVVSVSPAIQDGINLENRYTSILVWWRRNSGFGVCSIPDEAFYYFWIGRIVRHEYTYWVERKGRR